MTSRLDRFLASPPRRISPVAVTARKAKGSRRYPKSWLTDCVAEQKGRCHYCLAPLRKKPIRAEEHLRATIDHVVPLSAGGKNCRGNVVAACQSCNQAKGSMSVEEFGEALERRRSARRGL